MALYVMADTHFSLSSGKPMDVFGGRWQDYHNKIEKRWRSVVSDGDTVVVPGDVSWAMALDEAKEDLLLLNSLPGEKIILKGNHEYWWSTVSKIEKFFKENGIDKIKLLHNNAYFAEGFEICGTRGWYSENSNPGNAEEYKKIVAREVGRLKRSLDFLGEHSHRRLVFLHFPPVFDGFVCREIIDLLHQYGVDRCYFGHIHGKYGAERSFLFEDIEMRLISADFLDFIPYRID